MDKNRRDNATLQNRFRHAKRFTFFQAASKSHPCVSLYTYIAECKHISCGIFINKPRLICKNNKKNPLFKYNITFPYG